MGPRETCNIELEQNANEERHDLYALPNTDQILTKSREKLAQYVKRVEKTETHTGFWWENLKEKSNLEDLGVDGKGILKRVINRWGRRGLD